MWNFVFTSHHSFLSSTLMDYNMNNYEHAQWYNQGGGCGLGHGINRKGSNFKLDMVKTCSTWPSGTNMPFKKFWSGSLDPTVTSDPLYSLWKRQKLKFWILFLQWWKYIPINLKGTLKTFNEKCEGFYVPHSSQMWRNCHFWPKTAIWDCKCATVDHVQFLFKCYNNSF